MIIVGCDFHPSYQQVAILNSETGEVKELMLTHRGGDVESFYRQLEGPAMIGMEAVGNSQWFLQMLQRLGHEVWVAMLPRSVPVTCVSRRPISAMRDTF